MWKGCLRTFLLSHGGNYEFSRGYFLFPTEERKNSSEVPFDSSEVSSDSSEVSFDSSEEIPKFFAGNFQIHPKRFWLPRMGVRGARGKFLHLPRSFFFFTLARRRERCL